MASILPLNTEARLQLGESMKCHPSHRVRQRAHALLLSDRGYSRQQLSDIFDVQADTITRWIGRWNQDGIKGLFDGDRSGRPPILDEADCDRLQTLITECPQSLQQVTQTLREKTGKCPSTDTVKRVLKKNASLETRSALPQTLSG